MSKLIISHLVDKSFFKYGFVICKQDISKNGTFIQDTYNSHPEITVVFKGKKYSAKLDNVRKNLYRLMFKKDLVNAFQAEFSECFDAYTDSNGKEDYKLKAGISITMGFYSTEVDYTWESQIMGSMSEAEEMSASVPYPVQKIFYGAPGCGKSHHISDELSKNIFDISSMSSGELKAAFLTSLKASLKEEASYKQYSKAITHPDFVEYVKENTKNDELKEIKSIFDIKDPALIDEIPSYKDFELINKKSKVSSNGHLRASLSKYAAFLKNGKSGNVFRTTFHPDYDFSSFVGTYKPAMVTQNDGKRTIEYNFAPQVFTDAYVYAWKNPTTVVYLVIEEINRGNCAQIFGDLFQLLDRNEKGESEYPIKANIDLRRYLEEDEQLGKNGNGIYNGELKLPRNLNLLATMNTSDQSLFPMDSAFKRRWQWKFMKIDYENSESDKFLIYLDDDHQYSWNEFLRQVNKRIYDLTKSEDKQLGNFFVKGEIDVETFIEKVMFFLWSEVCKEEVGNKRNFYYTKYRFEEDTPRDQDKWDFKFSDLFRDDANEILAGFMEFLNVENLSADTEN